MLLFNQCVNKSQSGCRKIFSVVIILSLMLTACGVSGRDVALHQAVRDNDVAQAQQLLDKGANVNAPETDKTTALNTQSTALIIAAGKEYEEMTLMLLNYGADINAASAYGSTALSEASIKGNTTIVKALLEAGANVDAANRWGKTPLMWAADYGQAETVKILLQAGANPQLKDEDGLTALDFAREGDHQTVVALLSQVTSAAPSPAIATETPPVSTESITQISEIKRHRLNRGLVSRMASSPESGLLAAVFRDRLDKPDKGIGLYKVDPFTETDFIEATQPEEQISQLALSPNGTILAGGFNGKVVLWAINNNQLEPHLTLDNVGEGWINGLAFSPDGTLLAAGEWSQTIWVWRVQDGSVARKIENAGQTRSLQFSPDGTILAAGDVNGAISLYNVADGALLANFGGTEQLIIHTWGVTRLAFSPDGMLLAAPDPDPENYKTCIRRVSDNTLLHCIQEDTNFVKDFIFSPDGRTLITIRSNIHLWDVAQGTLLHRQEIPGTFLAGGGLVSPDTLLTVTAKGLVQLWALSSESAQPADLK